MTHATNEQWRAATLLCALWNAEFYTADDEDEPVLEINCNDVFAPGCADSETISLADAPHVLALANQDGWEAILNWIAERRGEAPVTGDEVMAKLTTKQRKALPKKDFAEPKKRAFPIQNKSHARNALSRVSANGTPAEKRKVRAAVHKKYPKIGKKGK